MCAPKICYLCGKEIEDGGNRDHVPPLQFFPKAYRVKLSQLITLATHPECNKRFASDEEYFMLSLGVHAGDKSPSGKALWRDIAKKVKRPEAAGLAKKIRDEFELCTKGGIYYAPGKVAKHFDPDRIHGVVWKIVRGLFNHHYSRVLPETHERVSWLYDPEQSQPDYIEGVRKYLVSKPAVGLYPGTFDYKITRDVAEVDIHGFAMLFWDCIIFLVLFHDPDCHCAGCCTKKSN